MVRMLFSSFVFVTIFNDIKSLYNVPSLHFGVQFWKTNGFLKQLKLFLKKQSCILSTLVFLNNDEFEMYD